MRRVSFETSLGRMRGVVNDDTEVEAYPLYGSRLHHDPVPCKVVEMDDASQDRLCEMFSSRRVLLRPDGWVTVELKDDWYGSTEYRATVED